MSLFDKIFGKVKSLPTANQFKTFSGYSPFFTKWDGGMYESELCRSAIDGIARNASKLSIRIDGAAQPRLQNLMKHAPNADMSWSQFFYRVCTILNILDTAFIVPVTNEYGDMTGIYPIAPTQWELVESEGRVYVRFSFNGDSRKAAIELDRLGIMTRHQYKSDYFGDKNEAITPILELIHIQNQGIQEGIKSSASYRFMARITHAISPDDLKKERERFTEDNFNTDGGGILLMPNTYADVKQIDSKPFVIDATQMSLVQNRIYNYFGVNEKILQSSASDEEMDSFFNGVIEPFSIQLSEVLTRMLFTLREQSQGNQVYVTANRLQYMSVSHKISMTQQLGDRGMITINEIRELFNYPPLPDGDKAPIRGEYYMQGEDRNADKE